MEFVEFEHLINTIEKGDYLVFRFRGLFGDTLHSLCKIKGILDKYDTGIPIILLHEYPLRKNIEGIQVFFNYLKENHNVKYYIWCRNSLCGFKLSDEVKNILTSLGIDKTKIYDLDVFQGYKTADITIPYVGIEIPEAKIEKKAVIFRYSGYHRHCPNRNRPYEEWKQVEENLLSKGYTVYLLGKDDVMPLTEGVVDLRNTMNVLEVLDFSKDASICISTTTFIYVWQQFVCPTYVFSDPCDVNTLNKIWKLNENLRVLDAGQNYMPYLKSSIR